MHQTFGLSNLRFLSELQTREMFLWLTHLEFLPGFYLCNWCNLSLVFASTMNRFWCVIDSIRLHRIHKYKLHSNNHSDFQLKSRFLVEVRGAFIKKKKKIMENSIIGLTPPLPPPFWPKLWKILKNINYFMASKSGLVLK